jgi:hypothetical protein
MRLFALKTARSRLLAILLVAMFSFAAIGATAIASATDLSAAKKCKKGYKKVGKKCKKKSSGSTGAVAAVHLYLGEMKGSDLLVYGDVATKSGFTGSKSITATVESSTGTQTFTRTVKGYGRTETNFTLTLAATGALPLKITAKVDGKTSDTLTVTR